MAGGRRRRESKGTRTTDVERDAWWLPVARILASRYSGFAALVPIDNSTSAKGPFVMQAMDRQGDSGSTALSGPPDDLELLIEKADQVRRALDELSSLREDALASAEQDAQRIRDEAADEARRLQAEAEEKADETIEQAHGTAGEMLRAVRTEMQQLIDTATKRRTALDTTLSALDKMADVLSPRPTGQSARDAIESLPTRSAGLFESDEDPEVMEEAGEPSRNHSFDDTRSEAYAPLDFERDDRPD